MSVLLGEQENKQKVIFKKKDKKVNILIYKGVNYTSRNSLVLEIGCGFEARL